MQEDAAQMYESWRQLWLSGGENSAIDVLRLHGLRAALIITGNAHGGQFHLSEHPSLESAPVLDDASIADVIIAEAASQVRHLLQTADGPTRVIGRNGGAYHV